MNTLLALSTLALSTSFQANPERVSVVSALKAAQSFTYKFEMEITTAAEKVLVTGKLTQSVNKLEGELTRWSSDWLEFKATHSEQETEVPTTIAKYAINKAGDITAWDGGVAQIDNARFFLFSRFVGPKASVAIGDVYKAEFQAIKGGQPAYSYTGKYVGHEKLKDIDMLKFTGKYAESGTNSLTSTSEFWVKPDGTVAKVISKFANYDIPPIGGPQSGVVTYTLDK